MLVPDYTTLTEHEKLLSEKGYLSEQFKPGYKMGYWLREMQEQFDSARYQAITNSKKVKFRMTTIGNFKFNMERVYFQLTYEYNPDKEWLRLRSLRAQLDHVRKTYFLRDSKDLPEALDVHELLSKQYNQRYKSTQFVRMEKELKNRRVL